MKKTQRLKANETMYYGELVPATPELLAAIEKESACTRVYEGTWQIKANNNHLRYKAFIKHRRKKAKDMSK